MQEWRTIGSRILMKREVSDDSEEHGESSQGWPPRLFDEIVNLLAEALVLDYQRVSGPTVSSPPQTNRKFLPNSLSGLLDSARQSARSTDSDVSTSPDSIKEAL